MDEVFQFKTHDSINHSLDIISMSYEYNDTYQSSTVSCRDIHRLNSTEWCTFVNETDSCKIYDGFLDYTSFIYCEFNNSLLPLGISLLVVWLMFLFVAMAVCADDFFCPPLVVIARILRMSDNVAGVTLLAFGNGAADVFSSIAAVKSAQNGDVGLAIGALLGAGILLATVIAGSINIITPCHIAERPFLRDIGFFIVAVFMLFYVLYDRKITLYEAIAFLMVYVLYAAVVVIGRYVNQRHRNESSSALAVEQNANIEGADNTNEISQVENDHENIESDDGDDGNAVYSPENDADPILSVEEQSSPLQEFFVAISPLNKNMFIHANWCKKIYFIVQIPILFTFKLAIPVVDCSKPKNGWNRHLNALHCIISPILAVLLIDLPTLTYNIGGKFPIYGVILICGAILAVIVLLTSKNSDPPIYHSIYALIGFGVGVIWTDIIATEVVNLLTTIGIVINISSALLGLTLLAWGNSVADYMADVVMALKGYPRAALSACYGGPLFNIFLGIGLPFTITIVSNGTAVIEFPLVQVILVASLMAILVVTLIAVPLQKFVMGKPFGIFLIAYYVVFVVLVVLAETGVIKGNI